jgi:HEAT repeat protein
MPVLILALEHSNKNVRKTAAEVLGEIGTEKTIDYLINVPSEDEDDSVCLSTIAAISKLCSRYKEVFH